MDNLVINGGKKLHGKIRVNGAKNAALPIIASCLLARGRHKIVGAPNLRDIGTMAKLMEHIGAKIVRDSGSLFIDVENFNADEAPYDLVKTMRASVLVLGPLVGLLKHAKVSLPGGCAIGARPIDLHLKSLEAMGADIKLAEGYVEVSAKKLHGADITFDKVTVTGTENIMMAASLAEGTTILRNSAKEPEVVDLADRLNKMGAIISGAGTDCIEIEGVKELHACEHRIIPDRIEAATFLIAGAITGGELEVENFPTDMLATVCARLTDAGCEITTTENTARIKGPKRPTAVNITTAPHPGFATDVQAQFMALMAKADGTSIITETIFENRFMHVSELVRMGSDITIDGRTAVVKGVEKLNGAKVMATDLRASASLVLAALCAEGTTEISRIYHLDRGYERIEERLSLVGADIARVPEQNG